MSKKHDENKDDNTMMVNINDEKNYDELIIIIIKIYNIEHCIFLYKSSILYSIFSLCLKHLNSFL